MVVRAEPMTIAPVNTRMPRHRMLLCAQLIAAMVIATAVQLPARADATSSVAPPSPDDFATTPADRNERSTPRVSVLPASPAIAHGREHSGERISLGLAKAVLLRLGYPVGRLDNRTTAKFKAALFRYQRAHGIPSSGTLNEATLQSLGITPK